MTTTQRAAAHSYELDDDGCGKPSRLFPATESLPADAERVEKQPAA
jgi:hypothetical protein